MKNILLIAYHFHPDLAVGAQRTIKFAKYLPKFGWQPHVLTVKSHHYSNRDESPLEFDSPIHRTSKWLAPDDVYGWINRISGRRKSNANQLARDVAPDCISNKANASPESPWWRKLLGTLASTPDAYLGWYVPAVAAGLRLCRRHRFDAIYSSGPPHSCHLVALTVNKLTRIPWVVDFRDPWAYDRPFYKMILPYTKKFNERYEEKSVKNASLVLTTTEEWRDQLVQTYSPHMDHKCHTVVNGFDTDDFASINRSEPQGSSRRVTFLHAGNLYANRDPSGLLTSAGELLAEGQISRDELQFQFYGHAGEVASRITRLIEEYGLHDMVMFADPVKRADYLDMLAKADVLVLFQSDRSRVCIPAKTFEYLATGNQILTLTGEGSTRNFLSAYKQVLVAEPNDKDRIKDCLKEIIRRRKAEGSNPAVDPAIDALTKLKLTEELARLLDTVTSTDR